MLRLILTAADLVLRTAHRERARFDEHHLHIATIRHNKRLRLERFDSRHIELLLRCIVLRKLCDGKGRQRYGQKDQKDRKDGSPHNEGH